MITITTFTNQRKIPISDVLLHQPQNSWRSKIFPTYRMISYDGAAPVQLNCAQVQFPQLEQIDLIWLHMLKYKQFIQLETNIYEYKVFFSYNQGAYKAEMAKRMIKIIVGGCKVRNIPMLCSPNDVCDSWLWQDDIHKSLAVIATECKIPIEKLRLNYALHFPILRDLELHVASFGDIYNSI